MYAPYEREGKGMHALNAGVNPFGAAAALGVKGLVFLGLVLTAGVVFVVVRRMVNGKRPK